MPYYDGKGSLPYMKFRFYAIRTFCENAHSFVGEIFCIREGILRMLQNFYNLFCKRTNFHHNFRL